MSIEHISAWAHLPNAVHIDRILASIKTHPDQWAKVREASCYAGRNGARDESWDVAVWMATWDVVWNIVQVAPLETSLDALLCLLAYDDCAYMLDSEVEELKILAALGDHKAILLLPACIALNAIKELQNDS